MMKFSKESVEWIKDQWYAYVIRKAENNEPVTVSAYSKSMAERIGNGVTEEDISRLLK